MPCHRPHQRTVPRRLIAIVLSAVWLIGSTPAPSPAQPPPPAATVATPDYPPEQLDAILAPIALYPDQLLTQVLMASAYPLEVVQAARWIDDPANRALRGDALTQALAQQDWDPSVKSLVPFPQVLAMMNGQLPWLQQLGYAVAERQGAVMAAVQRLRRQAAITGALHSTDQQVVRDEAQVIVIEPAQPAMVYVPNYAPAQVYGAWPYPSYPPVDLPPPPGYGFGPGLATGLAFGVGVVIVGGLWGWVRPNWRDRKISVNVNRFNGINVNRPPVRDPDWRPATVNNRPIGGFRPPRPIGSFSGGPSGGSSLPNVITPGNGLRPPTATGGADRSVGRQVRPPAGFIRPPAPPGGIDRPIPSGRPAGGGGARPGFASAKAPVASGRAPQVSQPSAPVHGGGRNRM
ncbi:DUF3300 domain-containing protein [Rhodopila sp.]|uniref:DUF3300 domain-containing protein n=1 Tax=Rhodopila sp. TaxID=2480087 RepID=UPI003D0E81D9